MQQRALLKKQLSVIWALWIWTPTNKQAWSPMRAQCVLCALAQTIRMEHPTRATRYRKGENLKEAKVGMAKFGTTSLYQISPSYSRTEAIGLNKTFLMHIITNTSALRFEAEAARLP